jgi:hypothetical protein
VCFRVWEGGFESNNNNEMVARGVLATIDITCKVCYPTISEEYN